MIDPTTHFQVQDRGRIIHCLPPILFLSEFVLLNTYSFFFELSSIITHIKNFILDDNIINYIG